MRKQRGLSLGGFVVLCFVLLFVGIIGFKLFVPYMQFFTIQKTFKQIANDPEVKAGSAKDVQLAFVKQSMIDSNNNAIGPEDIDVTKEDNEVVLSASYSVKIPLAGNVSLLIDFNPSSKN